jgi:hypothetical protein
MAMDPDENQGAAASRALGWCAIGHGLWPSAVVAVHSESQIPLSLSASLGVIRPLRVGLHRNLWSLSYNFPHAGVGYRESKVR